MSIPHRSGARRRRPVFTTDDFRPGERFDAFNEEFARRIMGLEMRRSEEEPFHGEVSMRLVGPLVCARMATSPLGYARTTARLQDGDDCVVLGIQTEGRSILEQLGVTSDSLVDFATMTTNAHEGGGSFSGAGIAIRIPRVLLATYLPASQTFTPAVIRRNSHLAHLVGGYVTSYLSLPAEGVDQEIGNAVGRHVIDLVALAMGASGEAREAIEAGGLRAARRGAVLDQIAKRFATPGFSPDLAARSVGISERYLRQLLEEAGTSFTDLVLEHRLDRARQLLTDPTQRYIRITDIAYDVGFSDLSYFNRAFRRRYSATPSDVRAEALGL
jgi:AraC-like DNA-binding protein